MRLHLPKALLAAVLAACLAWPASVGASTLTSEKTTIGGVTYSGYVVEYTGTSDEMFHKGTFAETTEETDTTETETIGKHLTITSGSTTASAKFDPYADGSVSTTVKQELWKLFCSGQSFTHGHTLKLNSGEPSDSSVSSARTITFDFSPITLGGIIATGDASSYTLVSNGNRKIELSGNSSSGVNMAIGVNTTLNANAEAIEINTGGSWVISKGKSLTLSSTSASGVSIKSGQTVNVTANGTEGTATLAFTGNINNSGTLTIGSGVNMTVAASNTLNSTTITNDGTITLASGAIIALDQLLATSDFTTTATTTGAHTATNGAFTFATGDGTVSVGDTLSYTYNGVTANVTWNEGHKTGTASVPYYFIAENDTATYANASAGAPAWITVSAGATLSELPNDADNSRTSNVGINIKGSGTLSMSTTTGQQQVTINAGRLEEFTGSLLIEKGRFNERNGDHVFRNVTVQNGGQFFIEDSCTYNGSVSIAGTGWNSSNDAAATGALRLGSGAVLSGPLTLASDANVRVHDGGTGSISSSLDSNYILTKVGGGTLLLSGPSIDLKGITVSDGSLYLGGNHDNTSTVTKATAVALDSLTIQQGKSVTANYMKGTIKSVELAGGTFNYRDCYEKNDTNALNITTMTVSADSAFTRTWKGIVNVSELTGTGNIAISNINTKSSGDIVDLNVTTLKDYTGTISSSTDKVALKISSVNQSADKQGTISSAATLADGFTKTGAGAIEFSGNVDANGATISAGTLSFGGTVKITSGKSIVVSSDQGVSLTHDGFTYNGTTITTPTAANALSLFNNATVTNGTLTQTANASATEKYKDIGATLSNVKLVNTTNLATWLTADGTLSAADIGGTLRVGRDDMTWNETTQQNDIRVLKKVTVTVSGKADVTGEVKIETGSTFKLTGQDTTSSIATLTGSGTLKTTGGKTEVTNASGFSGTLAATGGNIELQTAADLTLSEVVVSGGSSISGATSYTADKVSIGAGAAGSLVGSLSINSNGTITLDASAGATTETGGTKGLSLSALTTTLAEGLTTTTTGSLTLGSGLTLNLLNLNVKQGDSLTLFSGVTSAVYGDTATALTADGIEAKNVFSNLTEGDFKLSYSNNIVALVAQRDVPEPTTATLSLLALMGLAARRRRRKA